MTGEQMRAARGLLRMEQTVLAKSAYISPETIKRFEKVHGVIKARPATIGAIVGALEKAGVEFIPENGGGAGVRLRKRKR